MQKRVVKLARQLYALKAVAVVDIATEIVKTVGASGSDEPTDQDMDRIENLIADLTDAIIRFRR